MTTSRDLTERQFLAALKRNGMDPVPYGMGYINVTPDGRGGGLHVYRFNGGDRRRDQLAYLLAEQERWEDSRRVEAMRRKAGGASG